MPALWQVGQRQDAFIPLQNVLQADDHYVDFVNWPSFAVVELPTAVVIVMRNVCNPVAAGNYAPIQKHRHIGWIWKFPLLLWEFPEAG
ncbi:hypothetical protein ABID19_001415 [Mesorhizobium robiniae]|uniref:Uncharacterized protein n=1 Tax=Mesorhizobium robiniae TaxID=559315 RepID=A0ABV2GJC5_9HYPH